MTAEEIVAIAGELDCGPVRSAITFARTVAERCARLADECGTGRTATDAARAIREAFGVTGD